MDRLDAMRLFTRVVDRRSFTQAAHDLDIPRSTTTQVIRQLEERLGVRLLQRTTRTVRPTLDGEAYYRRCLATLDDVEDAEGAFRGAVPRGMLRVEVQGTIERHFLMPALPDFLARHPEIASLEGLCQGVLLNLSPYGRSQVAEHVDWSVWMAFQNIDLDNGPGKRPHFFNANDYNLLVQMVLSHQGVALGWNHLVGHLVAEGSLVRPVEQEVVLHDSQHYLTFNEDKEDDDACRRLRDWLMAQF